MTWKYEFIKGPKATIPTLDEAEPGFAKDTNEFFIGSSLGNIQLAKQDDLDKTNAQKSDKTYVDTKIGDLTTTNYSDVASGLKDHTTQLSQIAINLNNYSKYATKGDSGTIIDWVPAIQQAINDLSSLGGGTLYIPKGVYPVIGKVQTVLLSSNITIQGAGKDKTILKITDTTGDWAYFFFHNGKTLYNITFKDFTFDSNIHNLVTSTVHWQSSRVPFHLGGGYNYLIENVKIIANGIWAIRSKSANSSVRNCDIELNLANLTVPWFDISSIWMSGENNHVENNHIYIPNPEQWETGTLYGVGMLVSNGGNVYQCTTAGTSGATTPTGTGTGISDGACTWDFQYTLFTNFYPETAIEHQGHRLYTNGNTIYGYMNGILLTSSTSYENDYYVLQELGCNNCKVFDNTIYAVNNGIQLWPMNVPDGSIIQDAKIYSNTFYILNNLNANYLTDPSSGISIKLGDPNSSGHDGDQTAPIYNLKIFDNHIEFKLRRPNSDMNNCEMGLRFNADVDINGLDIRDNTVFNCGGIGLFLHESTNTYGGVQNNKWINNVNIISNVFRNTLVPIKVNRNVSNITIENNVFEQTTVYATVTDNMILTIETWNGNNINNINYTIRNNQVRCISTLKPFYPKYNMTIGQSIFPTSRGMLLEKNTSDESMVRESLDSSALTISQTQYVWRLNGKYYKPTWTSGSTIGNLKAADGTTAVTITAYTSANQMTVSDATNIKPNQSLRLPSSFFASGSCVVVAVVGNVIITGDNHLSLKAGITGDQTIGSTLTYYDTLTEVVVTTSTAGNFNLSSGLTTYGVNWLSEPDTNYVPYISPSWNTSWWITNKTTSGFTINFGTAPGATSNVGWSIRR